MNMAEYGARQSEQPQNINFELIIRGLKRASLKEELLSFINIIDDIRRGELALPERRKSGWTKEVTSATVLMMISINFFAPMIEGTDST